MDYYYKDKMSWDRFVDILEIVIHVRWMINIEAATRDVSLRQTCDLPSRTYSHTSEIKWVVC